MDLRQRWKWYLLEEKGISDLRSQWISGLGKWYLLEESGSQIELLELVLTGGEVGISQSWCSWCLLEEKWVSARAGGASICLKRSGSRIELLELENLRRSGVVVLLGGGADLS